MSVTVSSDTEPYNHWYTYISEMGKMGIASGVDFEVKVNTEREIETKVRWEKRKVGIKLSSDDELEGNLVVRKPCL